MLLLTCGAAWASWFAVGNTPLVAAELQLHASQHWSAWLAVLGAETRVSGCTSVVHLLAARAAEAPQAGVTVGACALSGLVPVARVVANET